jgi:hypothetical protein
MAVSRFLIYAIVNVFSEIANLAARPGWRKRDPNIVARYMRRAADGLHSGCPQGRLRMDGTADALLKILKGPTMCYRVSAARIGEIGGLASEFRGPRCLSALVSLYVPGRWW